MTPITELTVNQNDTVTINISSDTTGEVHLHGYDIPFECVAGQVVSHTFKATISGGPFDIEWGVDLDPPRRSDRESLMFAPIFLHGFGPRYDLPAPLFWYLLFAAAGVVVISFVLVVAFTGEQVGSRPSSTRAGRCRFCFGWHALRRGRGAIGGAIGVLTLLTIFIAGLFGSTNPRAEPGGVLHLDLFLGRAGDPVRSGRQPLVPAEPVGRDLRRGQAVPTPLKPVLEAARGRRVAGGRGLLLL